MEKRDWNVSSDEKIWAGFAYLLGFLPAIIIWLLKKDESLYVKFQAMQAATYSGIVGLMTAFLLVVQAILIVILAISAFIGTNVIADSLRPESPMIYLALTIVFVMIIVTGVGLKALFILALKLVNLVASVYAFTGKDWRYPVLGTWVFKITNNGVLP